MIRKTRRLLCIVPFLAAALLASCAGTLRAGAAHWQHPSEGVASPLQYLVLGFVGMKTHTKIACDPHVWSQVEALIRSELPSPAQ